MPNLNLDIAFHRQMHYVRTFEEVIEKGVQIEKALIAKGTLKSQSKDNQNFKPTENLKVFNKNKNVVGDGITDSKHVQMVQTGQTFKLTKGPIKPP